MTIECGPALPLAGRGIVVTRPARQAEALAARIREQGGHAIPFPVIDIRDVDDPAPLNAVIDRLETFDLAIFISPNAVDKGVEAILARRSLPPGLRLATIGRGSARELARLGFGEVIAPRAGADSESLLELPELRDIAEKRIVVFRGAGGRELLRDTLVARGASVEYAECYRRVKPDPDVSVLSAGWERAEIDAFVVTSSEGLRNLHGVLDAAGRQRLTLTPIFVPHPRIAATAREIGLDKTVVTDTGDEGIVAGLVKHFAGTGKGTG